MCDDLCGNNDTGLWHVLPPDWHKVLLIAAVLPGRCLIFYTTGQQAPVTWLHLHSGPNLLAACKLWHVSVTAMISLAFHAMQQSQDSVMPMQSKECVCHTTCLTDLWCYVGLVGLFASKAAAQLVAQQTLQQAKPAAADPQGSPLTGRPSLNICMSPILLVFFAMYITQQARCEASGGLCARQAFHQAVRQHVCL